MGDMDNEIPACTSTFDALYFCMTPGNQFKKYYREGTYDDCEAAQSMFFSWSPHRRVT